MKIQLINKSNIIKNNNPLVNSSHTEPSFRGDDGKTSVKKPLLEAFLEYDATIKKSEIQSSKRKQEAALSQFEESKTLFQKGDNKKALSLFSSSYKTLGTTLKMSDDLYGAFYEFGGDVYQKNGKVKEANAMYQNVVAKMASSKNANELDFTPIMNKLAQNYLLQGNINAADDILDKTIETATKPQDVVENLILRLCNGSGNPNDALGIIGYANTLEGLNSLKSRSELQFIASLIHRNNGEFKQSNSRIEQTISGLRSEGKENTSEFVNSLIVLASNNYNLYEQSQDKEFINTSVESYKEALKINNSLENKGQADLISSELGQIYFEQDDLENAKEYLGMVSKSAKPEIVQKSLSTLGQIALKEEEYIKSLNYFEGERKVLKAEDFDSKLVTENLEHLVEVSRLLNKPAMAQKYTEEMSSISNDGGGASKNSYEDLMYLGTYNMATKNNDKAQEFYQKALRAPDATPENKASALIYLGLVKIANDDIRFGIKDAEEGCLQLEGLVSKGKANSEKSAGLLFKTYSKLGEVHYFTKSDYKKAAVFFEKALNLAEEKDLFKDVSKEDKNKLYSRVGASYYKAQDNIASTADYAKSAQQYDKSAQYFGRYLQHLTDGRFSYSALNSEFANNVVDNFKTSESLKISTALEMLGVASVKNRRFQTAMTCFEASLSIRRMTQGEKVEVAKDLLAIGRTSMVGTKKGLKNSKQTLEEAVNILRKELGPNHPDTLKEESFLQKYYGVSLTSAGKYGHKFAEWAKSKVTGDKFNNTWEKEIIDDFHLIYKDLKICE